MNRKIVSGMMLMLSLVSILSNFAAAITEASSTTTFYVDPASIVNPALTPGSTFSVDVKVSEASYLYSWQVFMSWDKGVLECSSLVFGGFLDDQPGGVFKGRIIEEGLLLIAEATVG